MRTIQGWIKSISPASRSAAGALSVGAGFRKEKIGDEVESRERQSRMLKDSLRHQHCLESQRRRINYGSSRRSAAERPTTGRSAARALCEGYRLRDKNPIDGGGA